MGAAGIGCQRAQDMYGSPGDFLDRTNDSDPAGPDIVHERTIENGYDIVDGVLFGEWQGRIGKTMRAQVADHAALQEAQYAIHDSTGPVAGPYANTDQWNAINAFRQDMRGVLPDTVT